MFSVRSIEKSPLTRRRIRANSNGFFNQEPVDFKSLREEILNLLAQVERYSNYIRQKTVEIDRYFALPVEEQEKYKTSSYITQKKGLPVLKKKQLAYEEELAAICKIYDAPLVVVHSFITSLVYAHEGTISDACSQALYQQNHHTAAKWLAVLVSGEKEREASYIGTYESAKSYAALYIILGEYQQALSFMLQVEEFSKSSELPGHQKEHEKHVLLCLELESLIAQAQPTVGGQ